MSKRTSKLIYKHASVDGMQGVSWLDESLTPKELLPAEPPMEQELPPVELDDEEDVTERKPVMAIHAPVGIPGKVREVQDDEEKDS